MTSPVGIVGDFGALNHTHQATNAGFGHAGIAFEWVSTTDAWDRAAGRTPHAAPIALSPDDFAT